MRLIVADAHSEYKTFLQLFFMNLQIIQRMCQIKR